MAMPHYSNPDSSERKPDTGFAGRNHIKRSSGSRKKDDQGDIRGMAQLDEDMQPDL